MEASVDLVYSKASLQGNTATHYPFTSFQLTVWTLGPVTVLHVNICDMFHIYRDLPLDLFLTLAVFVESALSWID